MSRSSPANSPRALRHQLLCHYADALAHAHITVPRMRAKPGAAQRRMSVQRFVGIWLEAMGYAAGSKLRIDITGKELLLTSLPRVHAPASPAAVKAPTSAPRMTRH